MLAPLAAARDAYDRLVAEALRLQNERRPGEPEDAPFIRAYQKLAEAAQEDPSRWEAFAIRGTNRCTVAVVCRRILVERLNEYRIRGATPEEVSRMEDMGIRFIEDRIAEARQNFDVMRRNMLAAGQDDPDRALFAEAAVKYARGAYLKAADGGPGAADDFKALVARGWSARQCSEFVARCLLQAGTESYVKEDFLTAQELWDEGLRWAQEATTKSTLLMNKAGAFEADGEFGAAKAVLRMQAREEPREPAHWKHLGMVLGYENRLREALHCYQRARELCREAGGLPARIHGNAWLKAAMIHGKLLVEDGDAVAAWRLFLEYRAMRGDDYNFCLHFGDFAFHAGAWDPARACLERARALQPLCTIPHEVLLQLATRSGTPEEVRAAHEGLLAARRSYQGRGESPSVRRLCGGMRDGGADAVAEPAPPMEPDPLAGYDAHRIPPWILAIANQRAPFRPYDPAIDGTDESPPAPEPPPIAERRRVRPWALAVGLLVAGVLLVALSLRLRFKKP
jgi:tetratricopeptide (TPR) repeat protein